MTKGDAKQRRRDKRQHEQEANGRSGASGLKATGRQDADVACQEAEAAHQEEDVPQEAT